MGLCKPGEGEWTEVCYVPNYVLKDLLWLLCGGEIKGSSTEMRGRVSRPPATAQLGNGGCLQ